MKPTFPYISSDYFSDEFKPYQLSIWQETVTKTPKKHYRDEIEFIIVQSGNCEIEINNTLIDIETGDLIQLMPYHINRFIVKSGKKLQIFRIRFSIGLLLLTSTNQTMYLKAIRNIDANIPVVHLNLRSRKTAIFLCTEIKHEKENPMVENQELLHISLISFLNYSYTKFQNQSKPIKQNIAWQCLQYIQIHHQENLTIRNVSINLGISEQETSTLIKKLTNQSFKMILNQVRIRNATALLQFNELSTNQIGKICGYQTEANFYKQFKLIHNVTPNRFRECFLNQNNITSSTDSFQIITTILENCTKPFTLGDLANSTHLSKNAINRLLEKHFQTSFKSLLNQFRVQFAHTLLKTLELSINDVSLLVGFSDPSTFYRNYKKVYGINPSNRQI